MTEWLFKFADVHSFLKTTHFGIIYTLMFKIFINPAIEGSMYRLCQ